MTMVDEILSQLGTDGVAQIARQTGLEPAEAQRAVSGALPAILAGLAAESAASPSDAQSLAGALDRDHDGSVLDDLAGYLGDGSAASEGSSILEHIFGRRRGTVESGLGRAGGFDPKTMARVLAILAPIVMAALAKRKRSAGLDAGGVASELGKERARLERKAPSAMDMLGKMLDANGDGSVIDDLTKEGGLLGSLFRSR